MNAKRYRESFQKTSDEMDWISEGSLERAVFEKPVQLRFEEATGFGGLPRARDCVGSRLSAKERKGTWPMLRTSLLPVSFVAVWFVLSAPSTVLGAPDCAHWTRKNSVSLEAVDAFWKSATSEDVVRCLKIGAALEARDEGGLTPLHWAAAKGNADTVTALLKVEANLEARAKEGWTPLHVAATAGNANTVRTLIDAGANLEALHQGGWTPLHAAAGSGDADTVRTLIDAAADIEARDEADFTPLHWVAMVGNADMVVALLKVGANPKARTERGKRPIDLADEIGKLIGPAYWKLHDASFD